MRAVEVELPPICLGNQHRWEDFVVAGCGALPDDQAMDEAFTISTPRQSPGLGAVCSQCFLEWETKKRDSLLVAVFRNHSLWDIQEQSALAAV